MSYTYSREEAADILEISTRTLDRYVKSGKLRTKRKGKKIFIHDEDIVMLQGSEPELIRATDNVKTEDIVFFDEMPSDTGFRRKPVMVDYRDLYEDAMKRIGEKDRVIQDLSYRAGHAESELKNSISMIEYKKATFLLESAKSKTEEEKKQFEDKITTLTVEAAKSQTVLYVLIVLVLLLLAAAATMSFFIF
ncbi:MAG: helix-turn-helix domain-containing protein [Patescibacteria group bacterium]